MKTFLYRSDTYVHLSCACELAGPSSSRESSLKVGRDFELQAFEETVLRGFFDRRITDGEDIAESKPKPEVEATIESESESESEHPPTQPIQSNPGTPASNHHRPT